MIEIPNGLKRKIEGISSTKAANTTHVEMHGPLGNGYEILGSIGLGEAGIFSSENGQLLFIRNGQRFEGRPSF